MHVHGSQQGTDNTPTSSILSRMKAIGEAGLSITVATTLIYIAGFFVNTIYYDSFGISDFSALRARYIFIGILFAYFCGSIFVPIYYLGKRLLKVVEVFIGDIAIEFFRILLVSQLLLIAVVYSISSIDMARTNDANPLTQISTGGFLSDLFKIFLHYFGSLMILFISPAVLTAMVFVIIKKISVARRSSSHSPKGKAANMQQANQESYGSPVLKKFAILVFIPVFTFSLIGFFQVLKTIFGKNTWLFALLPAEAPVISKPWLQFWFISFLIYTTFAVGFVAIIISARSIGGREMSLKERFKVEILGSAEGVVAIAALAVICCGLLFALYALRVFPYIPRYLGGGASTYIKLEMLDTEKTILSNADVLCLLDRSESRLLVRARIQPDPRKGGRQSVSVFEIDASKVKSIQYVNDVGAVFCPLLEKSSLGDNNRGLHQPL